MRFVSANLSSFVFSTFICICHTQTLFTRNNTPTYTVVLISPKKLQELNRSGAIFLRFLERGPRKPKIESHQPTAAHDGQPVKAAGRHKGSKQIVDRSSFRLCFLSLCLEPSFRLSFICDGGACACWSGAGSACCGGRRCCCCSGSCRSRCRSSPTTKTTKTTPSSTTRQRRSSRRSGACSACCRVACASSQTPASDAGDDASPHSRAPPPVATTRPPSLKNSKLLQISNSASLSPSQSPPSSHKPL
ncbi:hypothetical protein KC19_3G105700 [Ceratodon purpureus]|uniref:Secreted protein n=1 Tax=Ceratodon purpureus TaxID=3225 RepID=A0A8T0IJK9_CERPU|nr:hypothetical protein KC19_3G105700 [Ceratodon purpureus]